MSTKILGKHVLTKLEEKVTPAHTALLVIDLQNDFCSRQGAVAKKLGSVQTAQAILKPVARLIARARKVRVTVFNVRMTTHLDGRSCSPVDIARRMSIWNEFTLTTVAGSWGHRNPASAGLGRKDPVILKFRNNAFLGTNLDLTLRSGGVRTVIIIGVATHACVLETAVAAQGLDYYVVLPTDCISSSKHQLHRAGLKVLKAVLHNEGLTDSERLLSVWRKS
jgi:nicotinamidase-related amidase